MCAHIVVSCVDFAIFTVSLKHFNEIKKCMYKIFQIKK